MPQTARFNATDEEALIQRVGQVPRSSPSLYGKYFEQFVITEIHRLMTSYELDWRLSYLTSKDGAEIDLIIDAGRHRRFALEIKSTDRIDDKEVRAFERLAHDLSSARMIFASQGPQAQRLGDVECLPWREAVGEILKSSRG